jgi:hypothetical protein
MVDIETRFETKQGALPKDTLQRDPLLEYMDVFVQGTYKVGTILDFLLKQNPLALFAFVPQRFTYFQ